MWSKEEQFQSEITIIRDQAQDRSDKIHELESTIRELRDELRTRPAERDDSSHHSEPNNEDADNWRRKAEKRKADKRKLKRERDDLDKEKTTLEGRVKELLNTKKELSDRNAELRYQLERKGIRTDVMVESSVYGETFERAADESDEDRGRSMKKSKKSKKDKKKKKKKSSSSSKSSSSKSSSKSSGKKTKTKIQTVEVDNSAEIREELRQTREQFEEELNLLMAENAELLRENELFRRQKQEELDKVE